MSTIQVILFKQPGTLRYNNETYEINKNQLVVTLEDAMVSSVSRNDWINVFCYPGELHSLYQEVVDVLAPKIETQQFYIDKVKIISVVEPVINTIELLKNNKHMMMRFILIYCLSMDKNYFSEMMRYYLSHNDEMLSYLEGNFMQPLSVSQFAEDLNVDVKKLNFLFYKNYGVSAKKWLLERRLSFSRQLLLGTSKKIADIALDSGFSNHAHFTDAFKKRYLCCPTVLRSSSP